MSFITKRERVFSKYGTYDLPARNEGKLKAYGSCTDARAWSHYCSDKSEHLVEIIKRNNDVCAPKYIPVSVIVETLMKCKNLEINKLKHKIEELESMLGAYDGLDLTCAQKCEIARAHEEIRLASKRLNDMYINLDCTICNEESDAYETGQGDELGYPALSTPIGECKAVQIRPLESCSCEIGVNVTDPRIYEMKEAIVTNEAKICAMQNTISSMEIELCEPYCIYASIFTAIEKIFAILYQNESYKMYLDTLTSGRDTRSLDIRGKILYKMKVLEKFALALISPCTDDKAAKNQCNCYIAEVVHRLGADYAVTSAVATVPTRKDNNRDLLIEEILGSTHDYEESDNSTDGNDFTSKPSTYTDCLQRLKELQVNYDQLMMCHEEIRHERDCCKIKCQKYNELELEVQNLRTQMMSYKMLWNEKEYYKTRSDKLDELKQKYIILYDDTVELETQIKAERELNCNKSMQLKELQLENRRLETTLNEAEKEKIQLSTKLQEKECSIMTQEQQIRNLSGQFDGNLDFKEHHPLTLLGKIEALSEQQSVLENLLYTSDEEKRLLQEKAQEQENAIEQLKAENEKQKIDCEIMSSNYKNFETLSENFNLLEEINIELTRNLDERKEEVHNLNEMLSQKSQEIDNLTKEMNSKEQLLKEMQEKLQKSRETFGSQLSLLQTNENIIKEQLNIKEKQSQELLQKVNNYNEIITDKKILQKKIEENNSKCSTLRNSLINLKEEYETLVIRLLESEKRKAELEEEIKYIQEIPCNDITENSAFYAEENEKLNAELSKLHELYSVSLEEKNRLETELLQKTKDLDSLVDNLQSHGNKTFNADQIVNVLKQVQETHYQNVSEMQDLFSLENINSPEGDEEFSTPRKDTLPNKNEDLVSSDEIAKLRQENNQLKTQLHDSNTIIDNLNDIITAMKWQNSSHDENDNNDSKPTTSYRESQKLLDQSDSGFEIVLDRNRILEQEKADLVSKLVNTNMIIDELKSKINSLKQTGPQNVDTSAIVDILEMKNRAKSQEINDQKSEILELSTKCAVYKDEMEQIKEGCNSLQKENDSLKEELGQKLMILENLNNAVALLQKENEIATSQLKIIPEVKRELEESKKLYTEAMAENDIIYSNIKDKELEIRSLKNTLKEKNEENKMLLDKISSVEEHQNSVSGEVKNLQLEHSNSLMKLDALKKEYETLKESVQSTDDIKKELDVIKQAHAKLIKEKENIERTINDKILEIDALKTKNEGLKAELQKLQLQLTQNDIFDELISKSHDEVEKSTRQSSEDFKQLHAKTQMMMQETAQKHKVISKLMDQIEQNENTINSLQKDLEDKDAKIYLLENHINELKNEIKLLHNDLKQGIDAAEELKRNSSEESYHSMQQNEDPNLDLIEKLQSKLDDVNRENTALEAKIEKTKSKMDTISREKLEYINRVVQMKNEREDFLAALFDLEVTCVGNSNLSKSSFDLNATLVSIERIKDAFSKKSEEISLLEGSIQKYRGSSQLLLSKTEEAKTIAEREIIKITKEKENALAERRDFENQLEDLKNIIKKITDGHENELKDIIAINLNQKSVIGEIRNSTQSYASLIKSKLDLFNKSFQNESNKASTLQKKLDDVTNKYQKKENEVKDFNKRVTQLENSLSEIESKQTEKPKGEDKGVQTQFTQENLTKNENYPNYDNRLNKSKNVLSDFEGKSSSTFTRMFHNDKTDKDMFDFINTASTKFQATGKDIDKTILKRENNISLKDLYTTDSNEILISPPLSLVLDKDDKKQQEILNQSKGSKNEALVATSPDKENIKILNIDEQSQQIYAYKEDKVPYDTERQSASRKRMLKHINNNPKSNYFDQLINNRIPQSAQIPQKAYQVANIRDNPLESSKIKKQSDSHPDYWKLKISNSSSNITQETAKLYRDTVNISPSNSMFSFSTDVNVDIESKNFTEKVRRKKQPNKSPETDDDKIKQKQIDLNTNTKSAARSSSHHSLSRVDADILLVKTTSLYSMENQERNDFGLQYIETSPNLGVVLNNFSLNSSATSSNSIFKRDDKNNEKSINGRNIKNKSVDVDLVREEYENKIITLKRKLDNMEKVYKDKMGLGGQSFTSDLNRESQNTADENEYYFNSIRSTPEAEIKNVRANKLEVMERINKHSHELSSKNRTVQDKSQLDNKELDQTHRVDSNKMRLADSKTLSKSNILECNVGPNPKLSGPCTCSLDVTNSETFKALFEQVDVKQRKNAEYAYVKHIANKIINGEFDTLEAQELSFLHYNVCRIWKCKLNKDAARQKKIDMLENEILNKQKHAQNRIVELDRKVAEERARLQQVREAVCHPTAPKNSKQTSPRCLKTNAANPLKDIRCNCNLDTINVIDCLPEKKKIRIDTQKSFVMRAIQVDRKNRRQLNNDEFPIRLRRREAEKLPLRSKKSLN